MRWVFWLIVGCCLLVLAYCAWPLIGAAQIAHAAARGDVAAVMERVDLPSLRFSLARQIVRAYLQRNGRYQKLGPYGRGLASGVGTSVVDGFLEDILTPRRITDLLELGRVPATSITPPVQLPRFSDVFEAEPLRVILDSYFERPARFVVVVENGGDDFGVHLRLIGGKWQITGFDIPQDLADRIANEIAAREKPEAQVPK